MTSTERSTPEPFNQFLCQLIECYQTKKDIEPHRLPLPMKNSIRFIDNNQNNFREKFNGEKWKLVCTWKKDICTNFAHSNQLCDKHNAQKRQQVSSSTSVPFPSLRSDNEISLVIDTVQTVNEVKYEYRLIYLSSVLMI